MSVAMSSRHDAVEHPGAGAPVRAPAGARAAGPHRRRRLAALVVLTALASGAALGCSKTDQVAASGPTTNAPATTTARSSEDAGAGRSSGSMAPGTAIVTTAPPTSSGPPTTASASSAPTTASTPTTTAAGIAPRAPVDGAASVEGFCARNAQTNTDFQNMDPSHDFANYLAKVRQVTAELAALAPADIKADVQAIADAFARITTVEQMDSMSGDPTVKAASDRVSEWTRSHCPTP